jgi:lipopolysaccharide biosynthesis regulator YciM
MEWLFLLLPIAAISGWWIANQQAQRTMQAQSKQISPSLLQGFNYLLHEQPDEALKVLLDLTKVRPETVETHLALGVLFRRRGEVEQAILLHEQLMTNRHLTAPLQGLAMYELGHDYLHAGLFDRAEKLFYALIEMQVHVQSAWRALLDMYQREKEWHQCLQCAMQLAKLSGESMSHEMVHFHCELAEQALRQDQLETACLHLEQARALDCECVRALMLQAQIELRRDQPAVALTLYQRVIQYGACYLPAIVPNLLTCYRQIGYPAIAQELLDIATRYPCASLIITAVEQLEFEQGHQAAEAVLRDYLCRYVDLNAAAHLLALHTQSYDQSSSTCSSVVVVSRVLRDYLKQAPVFQCEQCGFEARSLHWQCPSCRRWGSIKAIQANELIPLPPELCARHYRFADAHSD